MSEEVTKEALQKMAAAGLKPVEMAAHFGMTRAGINYHWKKFGLPPFLNRYNEYMPWPDILKDEYKKYRETSYYHYAYDHVDWVVSAGKGLSQDRLDRLESFYRRLEEFDTVIEFDPAIPPQYGSKNGGWRYADRVPEDEDLIIRVNKYVAMDDTKHAIWRFPERRPGP